VKQRLAVLMCCLLVLAGVMTGGGPVAASPLGAGPAKKVCHTVTKKVHGKKQKVKVCKNVAKPKPTATPTAQQLAQRLATAIATASSEDARSTAIQAAFEAADIGIYDAATKKAVKSGMETGANDFFLLSGETDLLAQAYAAHDPYSPTDLAVLFAAAGLPAQGQAPDPSAMGALLQGVTKWATDNPTQPAALIPLIVRSLGQQDQPATDVLQDPSHLDAVQFELLATYFFAPLVHAATKPTTAIRAHASSVVDTFCGVIRIALNPFNPNTYLYIFDPSGQQMNVLEDDLGGYVGGQAAQALAQKLGTAAEAFGDVADDVVAAGIITKLLHMLYLNRAMKLTTIPDSVADHDGPANSGDPDISAGVPFRIQATLTMMHHVNPAAQECLSNAGFTVPDYGPVPNVRINWRDVSNTLDDYGKVTYDPASGKTGDGTNGTEKGVSTLVFTPNNETYPGFGTLTKAVGAVQPYAVYGFDYGNEVAYLTEALDHLLGNVGVEPSLGGDHASWTVGYHKPRGFTFTLSASADEQPAEGTEGGVSGCSSDCVGSYLALHEQDTFTGYICGDNPYGLWNVTHTSHSVSTTSLAGQIPDDQTDHTTWLLQKDNTFDGGWNVEFLPNSPLRVHWTGEYGGGYWTSVPIDVMANVTEDTKDCPDNG
jgi:hypothetical protein